MLFSREHYDLMSVFERQFKHRRLDKEPKEMWAKGVIYQDGHVNELFLAYRLGFAYGKHIGQSTTEDSSVAAATQAERKEK